MAKREAEDGIAGVLEEASSIPISMDIGSGNAKGNKKSALGTGSNEANLAEL